MSRLRVSSRGAEGVAVTLESAGWRYVGFEARRCDDRLQRSSPDRETCVVVLSGRCDLAAGDETWRDLGRQS
ncbi:MAG TPA: 5-deoxy-glucuronate isomerase, partial [Gaiellaceae bacterium]|nr:5-deoxy-glucuronate isomerase [Gaiellaceae bacterium]